MHFATAEGTQVAPHGGLLPPQKDCMGDVLIYVCIILPQRKQRACTHGKAGCMANLGKKLLSNDYGVAEANPASFVLADAPEK